MRGVPPAGHTTHPPQPQAQGEGLRAGWAPSRPDPSDRRGQTVARPSQAAPQAPQADSEGWRYPPGPQRGLPEPSAMGRHAAAATRQSEETPLDRGDRRRVVLGPFPILTIFEPETRPSNYRSPRPTSDPYV
jgi:hypothetical protein